MYINQIQMILKSKSKIYCRNAIMLQRFKKSGFLSINCSSLQCNIYFYVTFTW